MVKTTPSTKYLDPRREPTKWLGAVLIDLLEQDTEESKEGVNAFMEKRKPKFRKFLK